MKLNRLTIKKFIELAIKSILVIGFIFLYSYSTIQIHKEYFFLGIPKMYFIIFFILHILLFGSFILWALAKIKKKNKKKKFKKNLQIIVCRYFIIEKLIKFVIKSMFAIALYLLYFCLIILLYQNREWRTFGMDGSKIPIWAFIFLFILFLGSFVLFILFQIKKRVKKQKTKKYIQIIIYGFYALWACGLFYTRLHPVPFWNKGFNKTDSLVRMIHEELKTGKDFSTIYKENGKALKHFDVIDVNTKSAGNFRFPKKNYPTKSIKIKKLSANKTFWSELSDFLEFLNQIFSQKIALQIYQKKDNDSVSYGSMGKIVNDKEVSIFIQRGSSKCRFYFETKDSKGYLACSDMF